MKKTPNLVYSTDEGRHCPECSNVIDRCSCKQSKAPVTDGPVRVKRETKLRRGKIVTVIYNIPLANPELKSLAKKLKNKCGTGGTAKNGQIEIQGDHLALLTEELKSLGWEVKRG